MDALFELGLFMGHLGRERTFVVHPSGESVKIPSDLAGLTTAPYQWPRGDGNHQAAAGPACDSIREVIRSLGFSQARVSTQVRAVQDEQARQRADCCRLDSLCGVQVEGSALCLTRVTRPQPFGDN